MGCVEYEAFITFSMMWPSGLPARVAHAGGVLHGALPGGRHAQPAPEPGRGHRQGHARGRQLLHLLAVRQQSARRETVTNPPSSAAPRLEY